MKIIFRWWVKITGLLVCLAVFKFPRTVGKRPKLRGRGIVVSNHRSMWDPVLLWYMFPLRTLHVLASEHLYTMNRWFGLFLELFGAIRVNRLTNDLSSLSKAAELVDAGGVVLLFPEGRRSLTGELLPFKPGAAWLSFTTDTPVTTIFIKRGEYKLFGRRPVIAYGETIDLRAALGKDELEGDDAQMLSDLLRSHVEALGRSVGDAFGAEGAM
ncbi:MAG: 1-acyl-sn-glycerol-3-phosphate acyltransferase [Clostridiales Family XIII bacterium]|jgi:1-acyl-sn-glycerol-3-phosphate acyltransferase|nr:1-acyl-sn-glycerol-3-phosphate acyltransferase [Clostridiales Family XIII bacterium]